MISYYLLKRNKGNDIYISIIIFGVSLIQVAEAIIHLDTRCNTQLNLLGSKLAFIVLIFLQPFFSILSTIYLTKGIFNYKVISHILTWLVFIIYVILNRWPKIWCTTKDEVCDEDHCKLNWQWFRFSSDDIMYDILYSIVLFGIPIIIMNKHNIQWFIYTILSAIFIFHSKYFATHWCFLTPVSSLLLQCYLK